MVLFTLLKNDETVKVSGNFVTTSAPLDYMGTVVLDYFDKGTIVATGVGSYLEDVNNLVITGGSGRYKNLKGNVYPANVCLRLPSQPAAPVAP